MEERYLYEVRPTKPTVFAGKSIYKACSILLTKDEVKFFLQFGPVYRKFANTSLAPIKVDNNIDILHRANYDPRLIGIKIEKPNNDETSTVIPVGDEEYGEVMTSDDNEVNEKDIIVSAANKSNADIARKKLNEDESFADLSNDEGDDDDNSQVGYMLIGKDENEEDEDAPIENTPIIQPVSEEPKSVATFSTPNVGKINNDFHSYNKNHKRH